MILATDVHYRGDQAAVAAGILFPHWAEAAVTRVIVKTTEGVAAYAPGEFYKRELPCLLNLLTEIDTPLETVVIDGYVSLGARRRPGLGMRLYEAMGGKVPVIGVAKSLFTGTDPGCALWRGTSRTPLYVTAVGMPLDEAKRRVLSMHGEHRIPTLLKQADRVSRGAKV